MSQENVALMRRALEAFNSGDPDAVAELAHPEAQLEENTPGLDRVYVGPEGFRQWYQEAVIEAWEDFRVDDQELRALDHEQVLLHGRLRARGRQSGVEVDMSTFQIIGVKDGMVARRRQYFTEAEALEAAGL
jgi:ketosteroid isomerase-like protein